MDLDHEPFWLRQMNVEGPTAMDLVREAEIKMADVHQELFYWVGLTRDYLLEGKPEAAKRSSEKALDFALQLFSSAYSTERDPS